MTSGRATEDAVLTAIIDVHHEQGEWEAGDVLARLEAVLGDDVRPLTIQRALRRFVGYGWISERPRHDGRPGRPRKVFVLEAAGAQVAQRAAARLVGGGEAWALRPLGLSFTDAD